jgi:hypothetical protein
MSDETPSPLFRPEDQPNLLDVEYAERIAAETGADFGAPAVHQWPSSLRINQHGSRRMVVLRCPCCLIEIGCFEDELPYSLDTHHPSCGGPKDKPHALTVFKVTRYGSGPIDLVISK